jgi:hypothetical protein
MSSTRNGDRKRVASPPPWLGPTSATRESLSPTQVAEMAPSVRRLPSTAHFNLGDVLDGAVRLGPLWTQLSGRQLAWIASFESCWLPPAPPPSSVGTLAAHGACEPLQYESHACSLSSEQWQQSTGGGCVPRISVSKTQVRGQHSPASRTVACMPLQSSPPADVRLCPGVTTGTISNGEDWA